MKKVAVITGTRAEYGLLKPLIRALDEDKDFHLLLLVTGTHLMEEYGNTFKEIEDDGFEIKAKIEDDLNGDSAIAISRSIANVLKGFAKTFGELKPDMVIVLGDRTEILAASIAASLALIPIAHIHGGETTEGAYDEFIRHSITKMSHYHFAAAEQYRERIIQLGEDPARVFNVGAIGIDSINNLKLLSREEFEKAIDFKLNKINLLITFHPVTLEKNTAQAQFEELLKALDKLKSVVLIFTKPNADKGGKIIIKLIDDYVLKNRSKAISFTSLGQLRYLSALQFVDIVVGNSSSGIYEAPIFNKPTVNIGERQKGRLMQESIITCKPLAKEIDTAIANALDPKFKSTIKNQKNIFGNGTATHQILTVLRNNFPNSTKKTFYDLTFERNGKINNQ